MASRSKEKELAVPSPQAIRAAREKAGLTQGEAAALVHLSSYNRWNEYEATGPNARTIDLARWELFLIKTGQR